MKRIIQLILFFFLIIVAVIFYKTYFTKNESLQVDIIDNDNQIQETSKNNLIKGLKYEIRLDENRQYIIASDLSELINENNVEIVKMQKVVAIFIDQTGIPLTIVSDYARYNNSNYNTNFRKNVKVEYLDNVILSNKMDLNFDKNLISIYESVKYESLKGVITTDNIKIDLITKKIEIYMDDKSDKVKINTKQ